MFVAVEIPDHPVLYARIQRRSDPDAGVVSLALPPVIGRTSEILGLAIGALDGAALVRAASNEDQAVENALVRLRAHGVHTLILLNAPWARDDAIDMLGRTLSVAGIDAFLVLHPDRRRPVSVDDWIRATWDWERFSGEVRTRATRLPGSDPVRHQRVALPLPVPACFGPVGLLPLDEDAAERFTSLRRRLMDDSEPSSVARAVRRVMREIDPDDQRSRTAVAALLDEAGYELLAAQDPRELTWRDLRLVPHPAAAAALTLLVHGLDGGDVARLRLVDIAPDGGTVMARDRQLSITAAARPYLVAARLLCQDREHLLHREARPVNPSNVCTMAAEALASLGLAVEPRDIERSLTRSGRWLVTRGLLLRRIRRPTRPPVSPGPRRCRHGLPSMVGVGVCVLSHSQLMCRAVEPGEVRPGSRYRLSSVGRMDGVECYAIACDGEWAGTAWRVETPLGPSWVQSLETRVPDMAAVRDAVRASQMEARRRPSGRR